MCVIFHLKPGLMLPDDMIQNASWNNPHGYGIVLKENKKLQVIKDFPENGNDPEVIQRLLEKNKDIDRYVHVRFRTVGEASSENVQPFTVYASNKRQVEFMHNGTLHSHYGESLADILLEAGITVSSSDSKKFAYGKLAPLLTRFKGDNGPADINDPIFLDVLDKLWQHNNRGLLICNDLNDVYLGNWQELIIPGTDIKFMASNNEYFSRLSRGPMFEQRKKEEEERARKEREERYNNIVNGGKRTPFPEEGRGRLSSIPFQKRFSISEEMSDLFEDTDMYTEEGLIAFSNLTFDELVAWSKKSPDDFVMMFMLLGNMFKETSDKFKEVLDDKEKATKMIATLKSEQNKKTELLESANA